MEKLRRSWKRTPRCIRRPLVLCIGLSLVIASAPIGAIPGPGGTIVFLLGIAVLASEFTWAEKLRDLILDTLNRFWAYLRHHPIIAALFWAGCAAWLVTVIWFLWFR